MVVSPYLCREKLSGALITAECAYSSPTGGDIGPRKFKVLLEHCSSPRARGDMENTSCIIHFTNRSSLRARGHRLGL